MDRGVTSTDIWAIHTHYISGENFGIKGAQPLAARSTAYCSGSMGFLPTGIEFAEIAAKLLS
jgi:hypothetical protein